jgi:hypothetical protein
VAECVDDLVAMELLSRSGDRAVLTRRGRLLGNEVAARLLAAVDRAPSSAGTR